MKKELLFSLIILFTAIHFWLFWDEIPGINALLFSLLVFGALLKKRLSLKLNTLQTVLILSHFFCTLGVVLNNSILSIFMYILTFGFAVGSLHEFKRQSVLFLAPSLFINWFLAPIAAFRLPKAFVPSAKVSSGKQLILKASIIPLVFVIVFILLFSIGNPVFGTFVEKIGARIGDFISSFFGSISLPRFFFLLLGFFVSAFALVYGPYRAFKQTDHNLSLHLYRVRKNMQIPTYRKMMDLKFEYLIAIILFGAMNLLLLILNTIDIIWVWFSFDSSDVENLSQFVHEGTYVLILSILISMALILFYFRGNLNFYPKRRMLRFLAMAWIVQNAILAISIGVRNLHYVQAFEALTYKRIGVFVFLLLVLFGLFTLYRKIENRLTIFNVLRTNTLAVFFVLSMFTLFNWDGLIAKYNLSADNPENISYSYIRSLSDGALFCLTNHINEIQSDSQHDKDHIDRLKYYVNSRKSYIRRRHKNHSWMSWNYIDYRVMHELPEYNEQ